MILKMYNEVTDTFVFVDNVKQVTKDYGWTLDVEEGGYPIAVKTIRVNNKTKEVISTDDYFKGNQNEGKYLDDVWELKKNRNCVCPCDGYFVYLWDKYKTEEVYSFKIIEAHFVVDNNKRDEKTFARYLLPSLTDVYLLNNEGKTVDKI